MRHCSTAASQSQSAFSQSVSAKCAKSMLGMGRSTSVAADLSPAESPACDKDCAAQMPARDRQLYKHIVPDKKLTHTNRRALIAIWCRVRRVHRCLGQPLSALRVAACPDFCTAFVAGTCFSPRRKSKIWKILFSKPWPSLYKPVKSLRVMLQQLMVWVARQRSHTCLAGTGPSLPI